MARTAPEPASTRKRTRTTALTKAGRAMIRRILARLVAEYAPEKVILYGSYAYGNPGPDSDIDLLIIKETEDRFIDRWCAVLRILRGTHPSVPLEPLVLTPREIARHVARKDPFIEEILRQGRTLYAA